MDYIKLDNPPIFIGGLRRSGTTLLRKILGSHSQISMLPTELNFLERIYDGKLLDNDRFVNALERSVNHLHNKGCNLSRGKVLAELKDVERSWPNLFIAILEAYRKNQGKQICGEKSPLYEFYYPILKDWFPDTGLFLIHMVRNPVDCYASLKHRVQNGRVMNVADWCMRWNKSVGIGLRNSRLYPGHYILLRYEDLVDNTARICSGICQQAGVEPEIERMLSMTDYDWQITDNSSFLSDTEKNDSHYDGKIRKLDSVDRSKTLLYEEKSIITLLCRPLYYAVGYEDDGNIYSISESSDENLNLTKNLLDHLNYQEYFSRIFFGYSSERLRYYLTNRIHRSA